MDQDPSAPPESTYDAFADLLDVLDLRPEGEARFSVAIREDAEGSESDADADGLGDSTGDVFVGRSQPQPYGRVFGGQVLAQSVVAAGRTVPSPEGAERRIHSLHGYFLRAGDSERPIRFVVERMRDGASFSARRVHAVQDGRILLSMITSFQDAADGLDHQDPRPDVPDPETLQSDLARVAAAAPGLIDRFKERRAIEMRHVQETIFLQPDGSGSADQSVWLRTAGRLPDDPLVHAAVLAYCSDYSLLEPVLRHHGLAWSDRRLRIASLDHAMWFHRPVRADDWILYTQESPSAQGGRGLGTGRMFGADGALVASVAQEGTVRVKED